MNKNFFRFHPQELSSQEERCSSAPSCASNFSRSHEQEEEIVQTLLIEFYDPKQAAAGFSERQQAIMSARMKEFSKKK
ncbi:MAG: hypothetical protein ACLRJC_04115 [Emergencia timonensis]|uniref:hypothetical protein n=1 Tax=Emergencia timonensis TaxID=1776384 RepID=UPI00295B1528|nr:hypothetical protein [Emergencia timonensis]WNX89103.1 hypothetical protein RVY71_02260 [Emergencia timonensis]